MLTLIKTLCAKFGNLFGFSRPALYGGIVILAVALILITLIIALVSMILHKKHEKAKEKAKAEQNKVEKPVEVEPVKIEPAETEVKAEVIEEKKPEPIPEPVKEKKVEEKPAKKVEPKKAEPKKVEPKKEEVKAAKKLNGKWIIEKENEGEFVSKLLASNGEVMLTSEIYTTAEGARNGIETIIRGVESGNFVIYQDKNKNYYYKIKSANNRLLCAGEIYKTKDGCLKAVESVKRIASTSPVADEIGVGKGYADYTPAKLNVADVKKGTEGKWRIVKTESGNYSACLYASNGQLMLATEEVSLEKSAKNAIESVKKYAEQGNFIIDRDKFGRFYYKLRNAQKSVICIGEAYDTLDSCVSAIESVRRFSLTAIFSAE